MLKKQLPPLRHKLGEHKLESTAAFLVSTLSKDKEKVKSVFIDKKI